MTRIKTNISPYALRGTLAPVFCTLDERLNPSAHDLIWWEFFDENNKPTDIPAPRNAGQVICAIARPTQLRRADLSCAVTSEINSSSG